MKAIIVSPRELREIRDLLHRLAAIYRVLGLLEDAEIVDQFSLKLIKRSERRK